MAAPGGYGGPPPQQWNPSMGPPPADFRQGQGPPRQPLTQGPPGPRGPPPMQGMPQFAGYGQVGGFGQMAPMPPPPPPPPPQGKPPPMEFTDLANLDEAACKQAMIEFVNQNCCYGKKPANEMNIQKALGLTALHYTLETFCEGRNTGYVNEPYRGGPVDGPQNGPPPPPWAIPCQPNGMFDTHTKKMEVPHTATIRPCHDCDAMGYHRCWRCGGWGQTMCDHCGGDGQVWNTDHEGNRYRDRCFSCGGDGHSRCFTCGGDGRITCDTCDGYRQMKCFIQLTVTYTNHEVDHIIERSDLPDEMIRHVKGETIFEQVMLNVWPITSYPVGEINDNSIRLVNSHRSAFPNEKQLQQRQRLRAVPVTEANYTWEDFSSRFWVYGLERKVHAPDYPQQCCWGCSIL